MLAALQSVAWAGTLYVPSAEFDTVEEAVVAAVDGDEIVVGAGVWPGLPETIDVRLTLRGAGLGVTVLLHDGSRSTGITVDGAVVTFEDLTLDGDGGGR